MSERIVSPGVYSQESDQSFVPQGQSRTGLVIVGPTDKGFPFVPTDVTSFQEFTAKFGANTNNSYVAQTVFNYLQNADSAKVVRVLGNGGWSFSNTTRKIAAIVSGSYILSVLHPSYNEQPSIAALNDSIITGSIGNFTLTISGSQVLKTVSGSLVPSDARYLTKQIGTDASFQTGSAYAYLNFSNFVTASVSSSATATLALTSASCTFTSSFAEGYDNAKTPWVVNEAGQRLFRLAHRSAGNATNKDIKIVVANIVRNSDPSVYTTFDILVRRWNDTATNQSIIEQYSVTLNPNSPNYIATVIGDKYEQYDSNTGTVQSFGDYDAKSNYIRVELDPSVKSGYMPASVYPNGHEALFETVAGFVGYNLPAATVVTSNSGSTTVSGFDYNNSDNYNYLNPIPSEAGNGLNTVYTKPVNDNKFILPFQGGLDGMNYATIKKIGDQIATDGTNVFGFDLSTATSGGTLAFRKALDILSNNERYAFDVLAIPGVLEQFHSSVTSYARSMVTSREDAVYIMDLVDVDANIATAVSTAAGIDNNYSATYYPWVLSRDINTSKDIYVPPSVVVPAAIAYNDKISAEWFAVAGLRRGNISAKDTKVHLSKADRDTLYAGRINMITKFINTGVVIFGQKTLQLASSALDRLNVRRAMIAIRGYIDEQARNLVFEQNTTVTRNSFLNAVNPYLESVKEKQGLYAYRVVMDDTNNTGDVIDRNELVGEIWLQPTKTAEFIVLRYNLTPTGAIFS